MTPLSLAPEVWDTAATRQWVDWLLAGYRRALGSELVTPSDAATLYSAPAVVVSHRWSDDPLFVYANLAAQKVWGYSWAQFVGLPSRLSAPPEERQGRAQLLQEGLASGAVVVHDLIRVNVNGRRFRVHDITLWNVSDDHGVVVGQAATYGTFSWLDAALTD